jgi:hypothetical protein
MLGRYGGMRRSRILRTVISNDLDQSLVILMAFLVGVFGLLFALAWLEQPHRAPRLLATLAAKVRPRAEAQPSRPPTQQSQDEEGGC